MTFLAAMALTFLEKRWAIKVGFVDKPGQRKIHHTPIALGGGIVIYLLTVIPLTLGAILALIYRDAAPPDWLGQTIITHLPGLANQAQSVLILAVGATVLHVMGLIDDVKHLGPYIKMLIQVAVAIVLVTCANIRFDFFIVNPILSTILSVLWIVIIINAFNFLDNMDGLSAGIAMICSIMLLGAAWSSGQVFVSTFLALIIGALGGFLVFNFSPAKIFMGDSGSLLVGLFLAVATIRTTYYHSDTAETAWFTTFMPLIVLAIPLYDFTSVTLLRLLQGKSPFVGDTQHFSHRLVKRGMSHRQAVLTIYFATACTGLGATILHQVSTVGMVLIFVQTLFILLIIAMLEQPGKIGEK